MPVPFGRDVASDDLDVRFLARAMALALQPDLAPSRAAEALVAMAGSGPAAPEAAWRARSRLEAAYGHRPRARTERAIEALTIAIADLHARRAGTEAGEPLD